MTNTLEVSSITKRFDNFTAVDALSFAIPAGTVYGLLGPNGAGKTTSIRMTIGITMPDSGEVRLFGEPFRREHLLRIGYLPEERGLYKRMKIRELLTFLAQLKGVHASDAARRAAHWLDRLDLGKWADKKAEELSKGMQQKVQFIAAVLHEPDFLILDEPFSGLDPSNTKELLDVLLEQRKAGRTIMFSTHRMETVERLCDSICLVNHGRSVLEGSLKDVKGAYGKSSIHLEYAGELPFLNRKDLFQSVNNYGNYVELRLYPGVDSQEVLRMAAQSARVTKFELVEPSLEAIFIDTVEKTEVAHA